MTVYSRRCNSAREACSVELSDAMGSRIPRSSPCFWPWLVASLLPCTGDVLAHRVACLLSSPGTEKLLCPLLKMQLQHKGTGKGSVQPLVSSWKQEPGFLIRENCKGFGSSGQNPEETNQKDLKFTSCQDCGFASHWDRCLDYQLVPALGECCKGALGRSFEFLILIFFLESDKSLSVRSQLQAKHLAVVPKNL